jgi:hypothetical protein
MVMLGALLEITAVLPEASIDAALRRLVRHPRWVELDERALVRGRELYRESLAIAEPGSVCLEGTSANWLFPHCVPGDKSLPVA